MVQVKDGDHTCVLVLKSKDGYFRGVLETGTDEVISEAKFSQLVFLAVGLISPLQFF